MARRPDPRQEREIAELRVLQRAAAEGVAAAAAAATRDAEAARDQGSAKVEAEAAGWSAALAAPIFIPELAGAWSASLSVRREELRALDQNLDAAREEEGRKRAVSAAARARADAAKERAAAAERREKYRREEQRLTELEDRAGQGRAP